MQESTASLVRALQPVVMFRSALAEAAAKERSSRRVRQERIQAIASLTDRDLDRLAEQFEALLHLSDPNLLAASLEEMLQTLSPESPDGEEAGHA